MNTKDFTQFFLLSKQSFPNLPFSLSFITLLSQLTNLLTFSYLHCPTTLQGISSIQLLPIDLLLKTIAPNRLATLVFCRPEQMPCYGGRSRARLKNIWYSDFLSYFAEVFEKVSTMLNKRDGERGENEGERYCELEKVLTTHGDWIEYWYIWKTVFFV